MPLFKKKPDGTKKKFKETQLGIFLKDKAPILLDKVADFLPDKGLLGIVKNIIDTDPEAKKEYEAMSPQDKLAFEKLQTDYNLEVFKLEQADKHSAREREKAYVQAGLTDYMFIATGITALSCFVLMVVSVIFWPQQLKDNPLFHQLMGVIEGVSMTMFTYYYGTTKASHEKTKMLVDKEN